MWCGHRFGDMLWWCGAVMQSRYCIIDLPLLAFFVVVITTGRHSTIHAQLLSNQCIRDTINSRTKFTTTSAHIITDSTHHSLQLASEDIFPPCCILDINGMCTCGTILSPAARAMCPCGGGQKNIKFLETAGTKVATPMCADELGGWTIGTVTNQLKVALHARGWKGRSDSTFPDTHIHTDFAFSQSKYQKKRTQQQVHIINMITLE